MNPFDRYTWVDVALGLLGGLRGELKASFDGVAELCPTENYVKKSAMRKEIQKFLSKSVEEMTPQTYEEVCVQIFGNERFENAKRFHPSIRSRGTQHNALLDYDKSYFLFGEGNNTICSVRFDHRRVDVDKRYYEDDIGLEDKGDATVPYLSATMMRRVTRLPEDRWHSFCATHNALVQEREGVAWIVEKLDGTLPRTDCLKD